VVVPVVFFPEFLLGVVFHPPLLVPNSQFIVASCPALSIHASMMIDISCSPRQPCFYFSLFLILRSTTNTFFHPGVHQIVVPTSILAQEGLCTPLFLGFPSSLFLDTYSLIGHFSLFHHCFSSSRGFLSVLLQLFIPQNSFK